LAKSAERVGSIPAFIRLEPQKFLACGADDESVIVDKPDRRWFRAGATVGWVLAFAGMTVGGFIAWVVLGIGLCEDDASVGSDRYCNRGGWEASGLAIAILAAVALVIPAAAVVAGQQRLFWIGVLSPVALCVLVVVLSATLGTT
jgi:hypothetical protein